VGKKIASAKDLDALEAEAQREIDEAVTFAESSPEPAAEALFANVYADN
jgi:pyruvate dehydrogenase E1 component alpha subunit